MPRQTAKPRYINTMGAVDLEDLPSQPPFFFRAVTSRVFPIKANMARLTLFCDQYLNMDIPQEIVHFCPALPYVYLMVLNYGQMSPISVEAQNIGWVAQHEVLFMVPLERWRKEKRRLVFQGWACVSPFIFVDDEMSLTTGREVYGWPKVPCRIDAQTPLWTQDPRAATRVLSMSAPVFPALYEGAREEVRTLMHIDREAAWSFWQLPPDPVDVWNPLAILSSAAQSTLNLMQDAADLLTALPLRGYRSHRDGRSVAAMLEKAGQNVFELLPGLLMPERPAAPAHGEPRIPGLKIQQITLKQFRDVAKPREACYQALVASDMGIERVNRSGLLGDVNLLRGDPSGGFTIRMYCYRAVPIVESLGMEMLREEEEKGAPVAILKPTFPFWTDVDLYYGRGEVICSRAACCQESRPCERWTDEQETAECCDRDEPVVSVRAVAVEAVEPGCRDADDGPSKILYNTTCGGAMQPMMGPFNFPEANLQVYPLLADPVAMRGFLQGYLNEPLEDSGLRFEPFGSFVYLMVGVYGEEKGRMSSAGNNVGSWRDKEVAFSIPVKIYRRTKSKGKEDELISLAMVSPFVYGNTSLGVITDREVNGRPAVKATITCPPDAWLSQSGPFSERRMLKLETALFPGPYTGQEAEDRTLLEIDGYKPLRDNDEEGWRLLAERWREPLLCDLERKTRYKAAHEDIVWDAKALALEMLALDAPVNFLALKQYRDAMDVNRACYQALIRIRRYISSLHEIRELEQSLHIRIHEYPGIPIAKTLGLLVKHQDSSGKSVVQVLQPIRPFWMKIGVDEPLAEVLCWRTRNKHLDGREDKQEGWKLSHAWLDKRSVRTASSADRPFFEGSGLTHVGPSLGEPGALGQRVRDVTTRWTRDALEMEVPVIKSVLKRPAPDRARAAAASAQRQEGRLHGPADLFGDLDSKSTEDIYDALDEVWTQWSPELLAEGWNRLHSRWAHVQPVRGKQEFRKGSGSKTDPENGRQLRAEALKAFHCELEKKWEPIAQEIATRRRTTRWFKQFKKRLAECLSPAHHKILAHAGDEGYDLDLLSSSLRWDWEKYWLLREVEKALKKPSLSSLSVFPVRLSRPEASHIIESLPDAQIIIECILSEKWEYREGDAPGDQDKDGKKPDFVIPADSLGPAGFDEWSPRLRSYHTAWRYVDLDAE